MTFLENALIMESLEPVIKSASHSNHDGCDRISSKDEIEGFLTRLYKKRILLSVYLDQSTVTYSSVIMDINHDHEYFILDSFHPRGSISSSLLDQKLIIETHLEGTLLQFPCTINAISEKDGIEYYKINFPGFVDHHQRREHYRVPVSITMPLSADLATADDVTLHAELRDLSLGGFCAKVTSPMANKLLDIGDEIPVCIVKIPGGNPITASLEVVRLEESGSMHSIRIGVRFIRLSKADRIELSKIISILERDKIKTMTFSRN